MAAAGGRGDVDSQIPHALHIPAHPQCGDDRAKITGHRLLTSHQIKNRVLNLRLHLVDPVVASDHLFRQPQVRIQKRGLLWPRSPIPLNV
jgi:hypothetical protein